MNFNFNLDYFPPICFMTATASRVLRNLSCISSPLLRNVACLAIGFFSSYHIFVTAKALCFQSCIQDGSWEKCFHLCMTIFFLMYAVFAFFQALFFFVFFSARTLWQLFYCLFALFLMIGDIYETAPFDEFFDPKNHYLYFLTQIIYCCVLLSSLTVWAS